MTAEIINLKRARKQKARAQAAIEAAANRSNSGRTKQDRQLNRINQQKAAHHLDQHKLLGQHKQQEGEIDV